MKYAFVTLSIISIWIATLLIITILNYDKILLPIISLGLTIFLFEIGIGSSK